MAKLRVGASCATAALPVAPLHCATIRYTAPMRLTLLLALLSSCTNPVSQAADRATYNAIAPEYTKYVETDSALSLPQRQRRLRTLASWKARLDAALPTTR